MSRIAWVKEMLATDPRARGRVLDAGTGGGRMTAVLAGFGPSRLVSVSLDEKDFEAARREVAAAGVAAAGAAGAVAGSTGPGAGGSRLSFVAGDLLDPTLLAGELFDLIVGDYLLAALAGSRPFREVALLLRLKGLLAPGGLLVLTGLEPFEPRRTAEEEAVALALRYWAAMTMLSGEEPCREAPHGWVEERLAEAGFASIATRFSDPLTWSSSQLSRVLAAALDRARASGDRELIAFASRRLGRLERRIRRLPGFRAGGRVTWSRDWIITAS